MLFTHYIRMAKRLRPGDAYFDGQPRHATHVPSPSRVSPYAESLAQYYRTLNAWQVAKKRGYLTRGDPSIF